MSRPVQDPTLAELTARVKRLEKALATTLLWIGQSAGSPLSHDHIRELLSIFDRPQQSAKG
jgi:hypothetical protein